MESDAGLIVESLDDRIVEPARENAGILFNLSGCRKIGVEHGYGVVASGAGPALIACGDAGNENKNRF